MNSEQQTLKIKTAPGDNIEIWKWSKDGGLVFDCSIPHKHNLGELILPQGNYVWYVISGIGEHKVE